MDWLQLWRTENVGPIAFRQLLARFGSAASALKALPELARSGGRLRPVKIYTRGDAEKEIEELARHKGKLAALGEALYPEALSILSDSPPLLSYRGREELLPQPRKVAIVGARNASANGRRLAEVLAADLVDAGYVIVSGLARGIDTAAHKGTLSKQNDRMAEGTIAVMAGGLDVLYPPENEVLFSEIAERGLIVAELAVGSQPAARHFPRRNRIISGLSLGVVVVEAAVKSGSLITARFALDQGREVMAVPGSPLDPRCRGCNKLIRENGAHLVEEASQILEHIGRMTELRRLEEPDPMPAWETIAIPDETELDKMRREILVQLSPSPVAVDELLRQCQCSASLLGMMLLELELAGRLERHPGNRVSLNVEPMI